MAVSPRKPLKVEWAKSIMRTSTKGGCWGRGAGEGEEPKLGAEEVESGWGWGDGGRGRKEWQSDLVGGACVGGWGEGDGEAGTISPDPWEGRDPVSGFWLMSVSQGASGAVGAWGAGPQWGSVGGTEVFGCQAEGLSGSYRRKKNIRSNKGNQLESEHFQNRKKLEV